jgi:predicted dehydrogenase
MRKIKWGILSTANIGVEKVIPAMQAGQYCEVYAIGSRSMDKAQKTADELSIPKAFGSYEELLADPHVEAIYNPLPNHLHVPLSIKALDAGKHVLCEKPIALSSSEAQSLVDYGKKFPHLKLMEAFMYRFHPQWIKAKEITQSGRIGKIQTIHSFFSYLNDDPQNIRNKPHWGGGGLMDIGCYNISLSRFLFNAEPTRVSGIVEFDPQFNVDRLASGLLDFGNGQTSSFTCATLMTSYQRVQIFGDKGRVEIEIPFNAPPDKKTRLWVEEETGIQEIFFDICDQYTIQGDLFAKSIIDDLPVPTPIADAVSNMLIIERILDSAQKGVWI